MIAEIRAKLADCIAAAAPATASLTLDHVNGIIAAVGGLLGIAYLLWKWSREARQPATRDEPFPVSRHEKTYESKKD
ncbi:hypothetical protein OpiT1DRAFT_01245 [Opitutaceae bacterium TAV1]|nr:hypothetical protein OpiT1DRAFT_01245 [Opitutaceae bacterium TAV1]